MLYYYNIRFPYRMWKAFKNILINIMGEEGEMYERDGLVKIILCVQRCKGFRDWEFVFSRYCGNPRVL